MKKLIASIAMVTGLLFSAMSQTKNDVELVRLLESSSNSVFKQVIENVAEYRPQVIYTQINRDSKNNPSFRNFHFNYNPELYYNPASMVKLPAAILSLEKLNNLGRADLNRNTTLFHDSSYVKQQAAVSDSSSENGLPNLATYIKRAFLISENEPYNRLYQFLGQGYFNEELHKKGYPNIRITRQFMGFTEEQNRYTNPVRFVDSGGNTIYKQPLAYNSKPFNFGPEIKLGKAYLEAGKLIEEPFDFTRHNYVPLEDFRLQLQSLLFPTSVPMKQRFELSEDDRLFLLQYLSQKPGETNYPKYDGEVFYDSYAKFFFRDSTTQLPDHIRIFNKTGWAYGFLTDVSYVIDTNNRLEFMLSATVYTNSDGILNDDNYDCDEIGYPFMKQLGETIYDHELQRKREFAPDLSAFKINYEKRDMMDKRPVISKADN